MAITKEVLFINTDYLKHLTTLTGTVNDDYIVSSVILSQDKYMQGFLGTDLYVKIKEEIQEATGPSGNYLTLLDEHIRKCTAWWTMVELIPNLYVQLDNGGLVIRSADNTTAISQEDLHREIERARQNAQFYTSRMIAYLCNNSSLFPEYNSNSSEDMSPETTVYYQNGMTVSLGSNLKNPKYRMPHNWFS
tara:strand:+ start:5971 stop:6543 length:573 start_codon:yes stop_codon:yes gene_type:complete